MIFRLMLRGFPSDLLEGLEQVAPKGHARAGHSGSFVTLRGA